MSLEETYPIVSSVGEECILEEELRNLLANKPEPVCYDGIEPSGRMDIAQGLMKAMSVNKLTSAGCRVKMLITDWSAYLNNTMGGDWKKIETVGRYMIEIWKALRMDVGGKVEFLWSSKEIDSSPNEYWPLFMDITQRTKLSSIISEQDELSAAQTLYPCMQCADIFFLKADICQLGMDQQKVNVVVREYCDDIKRKNKPIILLHHMLPGLQQGQEKMSKRDPSSSIFMEDDEAVVNLKIKKAYCPPKIVEGNPCLEYVKHLILPWFKEFIVERNAENGGHKTFTSFEELIADYESGELHPADLKPALSKALNKILEPVREHFKKDGNAKNLLKRVKAYRVPTLSSRARACPQNKQAELVQFKLAQARLVDTLAHEPALSSSNASNHMSLEEMYQIVSSVGVECILDEELRNLLANKPEPVCYDGFEPSGRMHIAQGVMKAISVNKLTSAGCRVKILIADWFAQLNNKMGGDLKKIKTVGRYMIEIWKALGMDVEGKVEFLWSSQEINSRPNEYWLLVMDIARRNTLSRIIRCCQIMGRSEQDELSAAQILYPCMQCADIFFLKADICQLGMDQRKVNVLGREYCDDIKRKNKPIILSHHMLPGLQQGQEKMSKSDPSSSIFMEDDEAEVNLKIKKAYCPPKIVEGNPCLEYVKHLILPWFKEFIVERNAENGGHKTFTSFEELIADYESGELHPADLKLALSKALNKILEPVREHFKNDSNAKGLLEMVKAYRITR